MKTTYCLLLLLCMSISGLAQVAIDPKGTKVNIDSSKWKISGNDIYSKNTGNVGIGISTPTAQLHTTGSLRLQGIGTNTINNNVLTTDASGNVTTRTISSILSGNAIISLNGLSNSVQTFAAGSSGTDFNIASSAGSHTFNFPTASATNRGLLSSANWTTFNNKIGTITATTVAAVSTAGTTATVNNTAAYWNAYQLQGRDVTASAPTTGQTLAWNGTAWAPANTAPATTTNTLSNSVNTITSTVNGVIATASAVNTVANNSSTNTLTTTVNGITGAGVNIINSNGLNLSSGALTSVINGISSTGVNVLATASNGLSAASGNVMLGGTLTQATSITTSATNTLALPGLQNGTASDSLLVIGTGSGNVIRKVVAPASFPQLLLSAARTSTYTPAAGYSTLVYNTTAINVGTAYNTTTGIFTAPATGLYQVLVNNGYNLSAVGTAQISNRIVVNGSVDMENYTSANTGLGGNANSVVYASTIVSMTAGQTITIASGNAAGTITPIVGTGQHVLKIIRLQ